MSNGIQQLQVPTRTPFKYPDGTIRYLTEDEQRALKERLIREGQDLGLTHHLEVVKDMPGFLAEQYNPADAAERVGSKYNPLEFFKALRDPAYRQELLKAPAREFITTPLRASQGYLGLATPHADTQFEKSLEAIINSGVLSDLERDPKYADALGPQITGVAGQLGSYAAIGTAAVAAGLSSSVVIPVLGGTALLSSILTGSGIGMSSQYDKVKEYERRTGTDVPWLKEFLSIASGGLIGITEVLPLKIGRYGFSKKLWPVERNLPSLGKTGEILRSGLGEGAQEATAGILQTQVARTAYDPDAYKNWYKEAEQEFVVGGAAGLMAGMARAMLPGQSHGGGDRNALDNAPEHELRLAMMRDGLAQSDIQMFTRNIRAQLEGESDVVIDIFEEIEKGMEKPGGTSLYNFFQSSYTDFNALERELERFERYYSSLQESIRNSTGLTKADQERIVALIGQEADTRMAGIAEIVRNAKRQNYDNGGLTGSYDYQVRKEARVKADEIARNEGTSLEQIFSDQGTYNDFVHSLAGGQDGLEASIILEEILGVHGGRGAEGVDPTLEEFSGDILNPEGISTPKPIDQTLAASDHASYSFAQIARAVASSLGANPNLFRKKMRLEGSTKNIDDLNKKLNELQNSTATLIQDNPIAGVSARERAENLKNLNIPLEDIVRSVNALEETSKQLHVSFLSTQLQNASEQLDNDLALKKAVSKDLGFDNTVQLDQWLAKARADIEKSDTQGQENLKRINQYLEPGELGDSQLRVIRTQEFRARHEIAQDEEIPLDLRDMLEEEIRIEEGQLRGNAQNNTFISNVPAIHAKRIVDLLVGTKKNRGEVFDRLLINRIDADVDLVDRNEMMTPGFLKNLNKETRDIVNKVRQRIALDPNDGVKEQDIINLLSSKNYSLRGGGSLKNLPHKDVRKVAHAGGKGVKSRPFTTLLRDLTGAESWSSATDSQKMAMYMRLAQIPKMRTVQEVYLPDMYLDESLDSHVDAIINEVLESEKPTGGLQPTTGINVSLLQSGIKGSMGALFDQSMFGEALARVLESRVVYADKSGVLRANREVGNIEEPGDYYASQAKPEMIEDILSSKENVERIESMTKKYNEDNNKSITTKQFIDLLVPYLGSQAGGRDLESLGILGGVTSRVARGQRVSELIVESKAAGEVYKRLLAEGAIPATLSANSDQFREAMAVDASSSLRKLTGLLKARIHNLGLHNEAQVAFVDEIGGMWESLSDVFTAGENMGEASSVLLNSGVIPQVLVNLAKIDPRNSLQVSADQLLRAAIEPLIFDRLQKGTFYKDSELNFLYKFVSNSSVPEIINAQAANNNLTWKEVSQIRLKKQNGKAPSEQEALTAAVSDFLTEMLVNLESIPKRDAIMSTTMDKIHKKGQRTLKWLTETSQAAEMNHLWDIVGTTTGGKIAQREQDRRGLVSSETEIIPGLPGHMEPLSKYAKNNELKDLRKAIALRDSATSEAQESEQQAKIDALTKSILSRRNMIRETVPPEPDETKQISDDIEYADQARQGGGTGIPVVAKQLTLDFDDYIHTRSHTLDILDNRVEPYSMSPEHRKFFAQQTIFDEETVNLADAQNIEGEPLKEVLEFLHDSMDRGDNPADALEKFQKDMLKGLPAKERKAVQGIFDRREPFRRLEQELAELYDQTAIPVLTSALWMRRLADNAGNWTDQILREGPISYTGEESGLGVFEIVPVVSEFLKEKYGMEKIPGLLEIFSIIGGAGKDEMIATLYQLGKQLQWTKEQHDYWKSQKQAGKLYTTRQNKRAAIAIKRYENDRKNMPNITLNVDPDATYKEGDTLPKGAKVGDRLNAKDYEAKLNRLIEDAEAKQSPVVKFWDVMNEFTNHSLKAAYQGDIITKERYDALTEMPWVPRYVPAESVKDGDADIARVVGPDILERHLRASEMPISEHLLKNITANQHSIIRDVSNNVSLNRVWRDEAALGRAWDWTGKISRSEARRRSNEFIRLKHRGQEKIIKVDDVAVVRASMQLGFSSDRFFEAVAGSGPDPVLTKGFWAILQRGANLSRELVTRSKSFIEKNLQRDMSLSMFMHGFQSGGVNFIMEMLNNVFDPSLWTSGALWDRAKQSRVMKRVGMIGGSFGMQWMKDPAIGPRADESFTSEGTDNAKMQEQAREVNKFINEKLIGGTKFPAYNPLQWIPLIWHAMGTISQHVEMSSRLAVYEMNLAKTGNRDLSARSATENINYGRSGENAWLKAYSAVAPFVNGMLQGTNVTYRAFIRGDTADLPTTGHYGYTRSEWNALPFWKRDRAKIMARMMPVGMAFMMLRMMNDEDEDYLRQSPDMRSRSVWIPIGDSYFLHPIPHELGIPLKVIPEQIYQWYKDPGHGWKDATGQVWRTIRQGAKYPWLPYIIQPFRDMWNNYDRYREGPIVNQWEADLPPELQRDRYTSPMARSMADGVASIPMLKDSPLAVAANYNYLVGALGGPYLVAGTTLWNAVSRRKHGLSSIGTPEDFDQWQDKPGNSSWAGRLAIGGEQQRFWRWVKAVGGMVDELDKMAELEFGSDVGVVELHKKQAEYKDIVIYNEDLQKISKDLLELDNMEALIRAADERGQYAGESGARRRKADKAELRRRRLVELNKFTTLTDEMKSRGLKEPILHELVEATGGLFSP